MVRIHVPQPKTREYLGFFQFIHENRTQRPFTGHNTHMDVISTVADLHNFQKHLAQRGGSVGFVPTMGYLHEGHASLLRTARSQNDTLVLSIFVNPKQFGPHEDFQNYPRDLTQDLLRAEQEKVDVVFCPDVLEMYPKGFETQVCMGSLASEFEGKHRPGHFNGVATVVMKLFNLIRPDRAYFGEKDWQQLEIVRQMVRDLNCPTKIVACSTERNSHGLALSSRNSYLNGSEQARAGILYQALDAAKRQFLSGERNPQSILQSGLSVLNRDPAVELEYFDLVSENLMRITQDMVPLQRVRLILAARMFGVRLIDNMEIQ